MVAVPYGVARVSAEPAAKAGRAKTAAPGKRWFARFMDALIEARGAGPARDRDVYGVAALQLG
jgi:hypothetical protein